MSLPGGDRSQAAPADSAERLRIAYVLDRPELGGGVKVVFQHAELLRRAGHRTTILGYGRRPRFASSFGGDYLDLRRRRSRPGRQDLVIATYWTTLPVARELALGPVAHFCQGYEGDYPHLAAHRSAIEEAYRNRLPTLVVAPHLASLLGERFGRRSVLVPAPVDPCFRPAERTEPRTQPRIALHGIFENPWKGVEVGLETIARLRRRGIDCRLYRFSLLRQSPAERRLLPPDRFFYRLSPARVARRLRSCDLLLFPSLDTEAFGLPLLEAMASKVPAVASDIEATRFVGGPSLCRVPAGDPAAFAAASERLLADPERWRQARETGFERAERFRGAEVALALSEAVHWARRSR